MTGHAAGGAGRAPPGAPPVNPWVVVLATTAVQAVASMTTLSLATIAPKLAELLGVSSRLIGYQATLVYLGAVVTSIVGGTIVRRYGASRTSQTALGLCALGVLVALVGDLWALALGSVVMGLGYGLTNPAASHLIVRHAKGPRLNLIFSIKQTGVPWGAMMAGLVVPAVTLALGWRAGILVVACLALLLLAALARPRRRWDDDREPRFPLKQNPFGAVALVWRIPALRYLSLTAMALALTQMCLLTFLVTFLVEEVGFGLVEAGVGMAVVQVGGVSGRLAWGWVADRLADGFLALLILTGLTVLGAVLTGLVGPETPRVLVYGAIMLFGATAVGWNGVYMAEIARQAPPDRIGTATGGSLVLTFSAIIVGPAGFALVSGVTGGLGPTYLVIAGVALLGAVALVLGRRSVRAAAA